MSYTIITNKNGHRTIEGPGIHNAYYMTPPPYVARDEDEAQSFLKIANMAYKQGRKDAKADLRRELGCKE